MRGGDNAHGACSGGIHHLATPDNDFQRIGKRHHPGDDRTRIFPRAMTENSSGLDPPTLEHSGIGIFEDKKGGNGIAGHFHPPPRLRILQCSFKHGRAQIGRSIQRNLRKTVINSRTESIRSGQQPGPGPRILRPAARKHEDNFRRAFFRHAIHHMSRRLPPQRRLQIILRFRDNGAARRKFPTAVPQGIGRIGKVRHAGRVDKLPPFIPQSIQRRHIARRKGKQSPAFLPLYGRAPRRLFNNRMGVCPANAEGVDPRPAGDGAARPGATFRHHIERAVRNIKAAVRCFVMKRRGNDLVTQCLHHLDQAGRPRRGIQMADIAFDRADAAKACAARPIDLRQTGQFDRITHRRARAMRLHIADRFRRHIGNGERFGCRFGLPIHTGREISGLLRPIVVDGGADQHRLDIIPVSKRIFQTPQHHKGRTGTEHRTLAVIIERAAQPVR